MDEIKLRFISIILDPGHLWSDHGVIDLNRQAMICKCSTASDADQIAAVMNLQFQERQAKQIELPKTEIRTYE